MTAASVSRAETIRRALRVNISAAEHKEVLAALDSLLTEREAARSILDDLCDWAQHVAAPEDDAIHFIVERAEEALKSAK